MRFKSGKTINLILYILSCPVFEVVALKAREPRAISADGMTQGIERVQTGNR